MSPRRAAVRKWSLVLLPVLVLAIGGFSALHYRKPSVSVPLAEVKRGEFVDYTQLRGEIKAEKSVVVSAPSNAGDLQIVTLAKNGSAVKKNDIVVQFDTTDLSQKLEQTRTGLKQAQAEIDRMRAQGKLTEEQDATNFEKSKFDVERAKLEASKQEILSAIDGEKSKLALADAEQTQKQLEQQLSSDRDATKADINSRLLKRDKAKFDLDRGEQRIASMTVKAPVDGMVTLMENWRAGNGPSAPEWRQGDRAWPGANILELPDMSVMQVTAPLDETDRGRLKTGQVVTIRIDAVPDREFTGVVKEISPLTKPDFTVWPPSKNFNLTVDIRDKDPRLRPGMSATARVAVSKTNDAILVPSEAVFQKAGHTVVYVLSGSDFQERTVEVARRGNGQCVIASGLNAGEKVATKDPTLEVKAN